MATITEIKYSQLKDRFDSIYYRPEYLEKLRKLTRKSNNHFHVRMFSEITESIRKGIFYILKEEYKEIGIPFIRVSNIGQFFLSDENLTFISEEKNKDNSKTSLIENDIVISKSGTIGNAAIITKDFSPCNISQDVIGIKLKEQIEPSFIITFLNSVFGHFQIKRNAGQALQGHLDLDALRNILIPIPPKPFQDKIEKLVKEAFSKRKLAEEKYEQAKQLLEKELGIDKLRLKEEKTFEANFSSLEQSLRFDSEYYKPRYKQITEFLKNSGFEVRKLKEVVKISDKKIDPTKELTKKFRYVPIAKINQNGEIEEWDEFSGWQAPSRARMLIKKGDVLVSSLGGSIDKIALVPEELNNSLATTGAFVINSDNFYSEFLFLLFRTELIKLQLEQKTAGAIMTAVPKTTFGDLLIPLIPKSNQEQISTLVRESFSLRKESKNLLEKSKKVVERAIENGTRK